MRAHADRSGDRHSSGAGEVAAGGPIAALLAEDGQTSLEAMVLPLTAPAA